jgi:hypothetical protein
MRIWIRFLWAALACVAAAGPASSQGAWRTYQHPGDFTDLIALPDEVWGATSEGGLLRFDRTSRTFDEIHRQVGGLASNRLSSLALGPEGQLWVGTEGGGLSRLSPDRISWSLVNGFDGLPSDSVLSLEPQGDTLWIGTTRGVALWNGREISGSLPDPNALTFDTTFANVSITGIVVFGDELWLSTRGGIGMAHISTGLSDWRKRNTAIASLNIENLASDGTSIVAHSGSLLYVWRPATQSWQAFGGFGEVQSLSADLGVVLAGTRQGIFRWSGTAWVPIPGAPTPTAVDGDDPEPTIDANGVVFAGLRGDLYEQPASPGPWTVLPRMYPVGNNCVNVIADGVRTYMSTVDRGISRYDGTRWRNWIAGSTPVTDTSFVNTVYSYCLFLGADGRKWAGCHETAIEEWDDSVDPPRFVHHQLPGSSPDAARHTRAIVGASGPNNGTWFGMFTSFPDVPSAFAAGLDFYDRDGGFANFRLGRRLHGLAVDRNQRLWLGYIGNGVEVIVDVPRTIADTPDTVILLPETAGQDIHSIVIRGDSAWVLGPSSLRRYSASALQRRETYDLPAALSTPLDPYAMDVTPDGSVWLGTAGGLHAVRPGGKIQSYTTANSPLASDNIRAVRYEGQTGALWIATSEGLNRFDPGYVPPPPVVPQKLDLRVYPNPAQLTAMGVSLRLAGNSEGYAGEIYDITGRRLKRFSIPANGRVFWDGLDDDGRVVPPGVYFVRARAAGLEATARIALLR